MSSKVLKPFNTVTRRFKEGDSVTADDLAGHALSLEDLIELGMVEGQSETKRGKATKE